MVTFLHRDPSAPEFWTERFERQYTPWDRGGTPIELQNFIGRLGRSYRTLIPGCGVGHEVAYFSARGWPVWAIDFSASAVEAARARYIPWADRIYQADFFTWMPLEPVEVIYERAFLCALPRRHWSEIVRRWSELLAPGTYLIGFFYLDESIPAQYSKGPPFSMSRAEQNTLLTPYFDKKEDILVTDSVSVFKENEYWQVWQRRSIQKPL